MNRERLWNHKLYNLLHSTVLLGGMVLLLAIIGGLVLGRPGLTLAIAAGVLVFSLGPRLSPHWIMRLHRARPLGLYEAPQLLEVVRELARRAELPSVPRLYYLGAAVPNAFAVGNAERSAIGVTDGLLRRLDRRELAGVLAHEIAHIRHHDLWLNGVADVVGRVTRLLALAGQLLLIFTLPLAMIGQATVPWLVVLLLLAAPSASSLLQLAFARSREFNADLGAVKLTGDPTGLASALAKLELPAPGWLQRILLPYRREAPSLLRTHPATAERVRRLRSLVDVAVYREAPRPVYREVPQPVYKEVPQPVYIPRYFPRLMRVHPGG